MINKYLLNVSDCKFYRDEVSFIGGETVTDVCSIWIWQRDYSGLEPSYTMKCHCSDNPNCFIKQLFEERHKADNQIIELNAAIQVKEQKIESLKANLDEIVICDKKLKDMLDTKEQECKELKFKNLIFDGIFKKQEEQIDDDNVIIDRFLIASGKSKDIAEPDEFEKVFRDIEQTYSENKKLDKECKELKVKLGAIEEYFKNKDTSKTNLFNISVIEQEIGDIINKANTTQTTIFDKIKSFDSCTLVRFIQALISCHENYTCDDCYIATLPFSKRICDTKETLEEIKTWLNEEFKEQQCIKKE